MCHRLCLVLVTVPVILAAMSSTAHAGDVIHVDAAAKPGGDGTSWKAAFRDLQSGLAAATPDSGDQLWVAAGIYKPTGPGGNRTINFNLVSGTAIYGGFNGSEARLEERDPARNVTILSGDLNGNDNPAGDALDATRAENSYQVVRAVGTASETLLDGLTITAGNANGPTGYDYGGGISVGDAVLGIVNCTINSNTCASHACGVRCYDSTLTINSSRVVDNRSNTAHGIGLAVSGSTLSMRECQVSRNQRDPSVGGLQHGGGMAVSSCNVDISNCDFEENITYQAGAMEVFGCTGAISECSFVGNSQNIGGALLIIHGIEVVGCRFISNHGQPDTGAIRVLYEGSAFTNCLFAGNIGGSPHGISSGAVNVDSGSASFVNCVFTGNKSLAYGGALFLASGSTAHLSYCTIAGNSADFGGGIFRIGGTTQPTLLIENSIIWGNSDNAGSGEQSQIVNGATLINRSCIQGWTGTMPGAAGGVGNVGFDPLFVDADGPDDIVGTVDDNLRLSAASLCIDRGDPFSPPAPEIDIDGEPRVQACIADLGAYETADDDPLQPDCNGNGVQDSCDLTSGFALDCNVNAVPDSCDIAGGLSQDTDANGVPDSCQAVPANNTCVTGTIVTAGSYTYTTANATTDGPSEPSGCGFGGEGEIDNDVWYRYLANCAGTVTISLCNSTFDARLAVYIGCPSGSGQMIACSDDYCNQSPRVTFANPGATLYRIRVGGVNGTTGGGTITLSCTSAPPCPADVFPQGAADGEVDIDDLLLVIGAWGTADSAADIDESGVVDIDDLLLVIGDWGPCQ